MLLTLRYMHLDSGMGFRSDVWREVGVSHTAQAPAGAAAQAAGQIVHAAYHSKLTRWGLVVAGPQTHGLGHKVLFRPWTAASGTNHRYRLLKLY